MEEIATVKDLIEHLKNNFKPEEKLCFFDEGGAWCELEHVPRSLIGDMMFKDVRSVDKNNGANYSSVSEGVIIL